MLLCRYQYLNATQSSDCPGPTFASTSIVLEPSKLSPRVRRVSRRKTLQAAILGRASIRFDVGRMVGVLRVPSVLPRAGVNGPSCVLSSISLSFIVAVPSAIVAVLRLSLG